MGGGPSDGVGAPTVDGRERRTWKPIVRTGRLGARSSQVWFVSGVALLCGLSAAGAAPPERTGSDAAAAVADQGSIGDDRSAGGDAAKALQSLLATGPEGRQVMLPAPPPEIAQLIRRGNVSFTLYDPQRDPQEFAGITRFDLQYRYEATSRWTVRRAGSRRQLRIRPKFHRLNLEFRHEVLVPASVQGDGFFRHPLVQHELDHVRISTDPRLEALFQRWIDEDLQQLSVRLEPSQQPDDQLVRDQVEEAIKKTFQRLIDMARIRYDQLDRETDHGQRALPEGFLERIQRADASQSERRPAEG